nr:phosphoprotein [Langya virus]
MSYEDRIRQIQNGLEIVDLVKKVRKESIEKPTYGRSAIGLPTTKDRTAAWELFHQSTVDETRPEELSLEERNGTISSRDGVGISEPIHHADSGGGRTYKESKWDEGDEPILENQLVTNIQSNDTGRKITYGKSDHSYADSQDNRTEGSKWSDGCTTIDSSDVSSILQGSLSQDTDATRPRGKTAPAFQMNPNAKEYYPKNHLSKQESCTNDLDKVTNHNKDTKGQEKGSAYVFEVESNKPTIRPRMAKQIQIESPPEDGTEIINLTITPKQRKSILKEQKSDDDAVPKKQPKPDLIVIEEEDEDQQSEPIENIDKSESESDITIFDLADQAADHVRRTQMTAKAIGGIIEASLKNPSDFGEIVYLSDGPTQVSSPEGKKEGGRKLRALDRTESGKSESETSSKQVKKGIEENTVSTGMVQKSRSKTGATQCAPKSNQSHQERNAPVSSVQSSVKMNIVRKSSTSEQSTGNDQGYTSEDSTQSSANISFDDYFDGLTNNLSKEDIMKEIYRNQLVMLSKLEENNATSELIKLVANNQKATLAKLDALDRNISRLGLAVSSMEQMLASMRIMIPGKPVDTNDKQKNPLLKPVIGRSSTRAEEVIDINPDLGSGKTSLHSAKKELFIEPLDPNKTNATQFIPEDSSVTIQTLRAIVINRVNDNELKSAFLAKINENLSLDQIRKIHKQIKEALQAGL